jgi:hypothetical protein
MESGNTKTPCRARVVFLALLVMASLTGIGAGRALEADPIEEVFPVGERLSYAVSWMGIHCGEMEITSFVENDPERGAVYRIVVLMRTTRFFDGIYRVRSRLDSFVDPIRMSSFRYEEHSLEKKRRKDEVWVVDRAAREVVRTKNGETTRIPIEIEQAFDPLAFVFRLRTFDVDEGEEMVLGLMTSKGAVETVARATTRKTVRSKMGPCDAVGVVPEPRDRMMFSKSGSMVVWIDRSVPHRPCRLEFDLSFGKLVASLRSHGPAHGGAEIEPWESWGQRKGGGG